MANKYDAENYEYLFVDIEWNQTPGTTGIEDREPIQIGMLATDKSLAIKKTFSKALRLSNPGHYNPDTLTLSHLTLISIMQANSEETVLQKVKMSFPKYKYVVVWTNDTYELLKKGMDKYGLSMPRHRVILFQQMLMHIASDGKNQIGFERALKQAEISYQKNFLHYSKHDVTYMYQLFCKCYEEYQKWTYQEVCYLNKKSHIIHTGTCRYMHNDLTMAFHQTTKSAIFQGNRVCRVCGREEDWNRLQWGVRSGIKLKNSAGYLRELPLTEENMGIICNKFRLEYNIAVDTVFIRTSFSRWIIHLKDDRVVFLQHENYRQRQSDALKFHKKCMEGYHEQKLPSDRFYDVVSYIKYHDEGMLQKLGDKSRIEKMFDMIKEQDTENMV